MKDLLDVIKKYLEIFPEEENRQKDVIKFIEENNDIIDWNNFNGHIVAGGFIYAKKERKFLLVYHKELKMLLYPGGHIDKTDSNVLFATKREIYEETGLVNLKQIKISNDELIPIDIDTHIIEKNKILNLPRHYHFEFRYLFEIDEISNIIVDNEELSEFKWVDIEELTNDINFGKIASKIKSCLEE